jgi:hypothetical protein
MHHHQHSVCCRLTVLGSSDAAGTAVLRRQTDPL